MKLKFFELRDKGTFIPIFAFATKRLLASIPNDQERWLLRRSGFGPDSKCIVMGRLECSGVDHNCTYDPFAWGGRTYPVAHQWLEENFDDYPSGTVIDVEFILKERPAPKLSEAVDPYDTSKATSEKA